MAKLFKKAERITAGEQKLLEQAGINLDLAAGAYNAILGGVMQKYKLAQGDTIKDGAIVRKPKDAEPTEG